MASESKNGKNGRLTWRDLAMLAFGLLFAGTGTWFLVGQSAISRAEAMTMISEKTGALIEYSDGLKAIDCRLRSVETKLAETATEQRVQFAALLEKLKERERK